MAVGRQRETTPRIGPLESWQRVDRDATGEDSNFKVARPRSELPLGLFLPSSYSGISLCKCFFFYLAKGETERSLRILFLFLVIIITMCEFL